MASDLPECCGEIIGVERREWYDGVAYWECLRCGKSFERGAGTGHFADLWARRQAELPHVEKASRTLMGEKE